MGIRVRCWGIPGRGGWIDIGEGRFGLGGRVGMLENKEGCLKIED